MIAARNGCRKKEWRELFMAILTKKRDKFNAARVFPYILPVKVGIWMSEVDNIQFDIEKSKIKKME